MYAAVFGEELQECIVFSQWRRYNSRKAIGPGLFLLAPARKGGTGYENQLQAAVENTDRQEHEQERFTAPSAFDNEPYRQHGQGGAYLHADPYQDLRNAEL